MIAVGFTAGPVRRHGLDARIVENRSLNALLGAFGLFSRAIALLSAQGISMPRKSVDLSF
jgi:hypothetical protein